ncbi:hypothetical protein AAKU67_000848 [Oxalobacteraceae bacterium GrIS 2.11]
MTELVGLKRLIAEQEIKSLCSCYARDKVILDASIYISEVWEGSESSRHSGEQPARFGVEDLIGFVGKEFLFPADRDFKIAVNFPDDEHATARLYFQAFHFTGAELKSRELSLFLGAKRFTELSHVDGNVYEITVEGSYIDHVERTGGKWKIKNRRLKVAGISVRLFSTACAVE